MRLLPLLAGVVLVILGLTAYYAIPNPHDAQTVSVRNFAGPQEITVAARGASREPFNISVVPVVNSTLVVNMTVTDKAGMSSQLDVRISSANNSEPCDYRLTGCLYQGTVSNGTIQVPLRTSGSYYLFFDNGAGAQDKMAAYTVNVRENSMVETISHDGMGNWSGLGLGAVGALTILYGLARKTVIPWE